MIRAVKNFLTKNFLHSKKKTFLRPVGTLSRRTTFDQNYTGKKMTIFCVKKLFTLIGES